MSVNFPAELFAKFINVKFKLSIVRYYCPKIGVRLTHIESIIFQTKAGLADWGLSLFYYHSFLFVCFFNVNS